MARLPELLHRNLRGIFAWTPTGAQALTLIMGAYALAGWGAFASKASANQGLTDQISRLQAERDGLAGRHRQLEQANIDLQREWQGKLAAAQQELGLALAARDAAKGQLTSSQRELVASRKRLDQARDRVSETGSIKTVEPAKKAAGKP